MNWLAHIVFAFAAAAAFNYATGTAWTPAIAAAVVAGALLPDVDHSKTKAFKFVLAAVSASAFAIAYYSWDSMALAFLAGTATALAVIALKPRHRGITHSIAAAIVFSLAIFAATGAPIAAANAFLAYASHLALDGTLKLL